MFSRRHVFDNKLIMSTARCPCLHFIQLCNKQGKLMNQTNNQSINASCKFKDIPNPPDNFPSHTRYTLKHTLSYPPPLLLPPSPTHAHPHQKIHCWSTYQNFELRYKYSKLLTKFMGMKTAGTTTNAKYKPILIHGAHERSDAWQ